MSSVRDSIRNVGWGIADQAISSLTNVALSIAVARSVSERDFGAFSVIYVTATLVIALSRTLIAEPFSVTYSVSHDRLWKSAAESASGAALVLGVASGACSLILGMFDRGPLRGAFVAFGAVLPLLLLQDSWRTLFFAKGRAKSALINDLIWALCLVPAIPLAIGVGNKSVAPMIVAWGMAAGIAAGGGILQAGLFPKPHLAGHWLREHKRLAVRFLLEFITLTGSVQLVIYIIGGIGGLTEVSSVRGALVLLGPLNVLFVGVGMSGIPEAVRILNLDRRDLLRGAFIVSGVLATTAVGWGAVLLAIPQQMGQALLGDSWVNARTVVFPMTLWLAGAGIASGPLIGLRATGSLQESMRARIVTAVTTIAAGGVGVVVNRAEGATVGMAIASCVSAIVWWSEFVRVERRGSSDVSPVPAAGHSRFKAPSESRADTSGDL